MHDAIDYLNRFLDICLETKNDDKLSGAYKRLSEVESKNGNISKAIDYLGKVFTIAN